MKAIALLGPRILKEINIDKPKLNPSDILVKVKVVGICGSDINYFYAPKTKTVRRLTQQLRNLMHSRSTFSRFQIIGHEFSGIVEDAGEKVKDIESGQRITVNPNIYCGECRACRTGHENLCNQDVGIGWGGVQGALAEFVRVPAENIVFVPPQISDEEAALLDCVAVALHAVKIAEANEKHSIAILGAGTIGLLILQVLRTFGMDDIAITDMSDYNLNLAEKYGVKYVFNVSKTNICNEIKKNFGSVDRVFECVGGHAPTLEQALNLVGFHGKIVLVGKFVSPQLVETSHLFKNESTLVASTKYKKSEFEEALKMLIDGDVKVKPLITHKFPFSMARIAFETALKKQQTNAIKVQIRM